MERKNKTDPSIILAIKKRMVSVILPSSEWILVIHIIYASSFLLIGDDSDWFSWFFTHSVDDVYATCDKLEKAGYSFKKKPDEGEWNNHLDQLSTYGMYS